MALLQSIEPVPERKYQIKIDPRIERKPQTKQKLLSKRSVDLFIFLLVCWFVGLFFYWLIVGGSTTVGGSTGGSKGSGEVVELEEESFGEITAGVRI